MTEAEQATVTQHPEDPPENPSGRVYRSAISPGRMAWLVLLLAFGMFCALTITTALAIYLYLFQSTEAIPALLQVSQGTVGVTGSDFVEAVQRERQDITSTQTSISTDSLSQATIQFRDVPAFEGAPPTLLAAVALQSNTLITFDRASRPRFDWSLNQHSISFSNLKGELDVFVTGVMDKSFLLSVGTAGGLSLQFLDDGRYRVSATDDEVRILNVMGRASAYFADDVSSRRTVPAGQELVVRLGNRTIEPRATVRNLLSNSLFSTQEIDQSPAQALPPEWGCLVEQDSDPRGNFSLGQFDGRLGLRLRRLDNATSHGEVRCTQSFGADGIDVADYDSIKVIVTFYVSSQSLSQCGILGSECPLMLRLRYEDRLSVGRTWIRGFYFDKEVITDYPTLCSTCIQEHEIINKQAWYTFESENLLSVIGANVHPESLTWIALEASGHQFDTIISEILLLVDKSNGNGT
ncbi:MAG: hypothetical protein OXG39_19835 [Chloroflexi bacterium]|nr:hypothetical protein [Chloroflexota bacterium]